MAGLFVSFEGGEGVGKSTQIAELARRLRARGRDVVATLEPGGTDLGRAIRTLLLDPASHVTPRAEALLYAADRAHHVQTVIEPALARGAVVLCDRYADSSLAYQGAGRELNGTAVRALMDFAVGGLWPDLTLLLDIDPVIGLARARGGGAGDRMEGESLAFHQQVRAGFRALADAEPDRFKVIDATRTVAEVAAVVESHVEAALGVRS